MKLYCPECFAKTDYKFSKPKFCPECGAKVGSSSGFTQKSNLQKPIEDTEKVKRLEAEIEKLKSYNFSKKNVDKSNSEFQSEESDSVNESYDDLAEDEDYEATQKHINNFKRSKSKLTGVVVQNDNKVSGISFGQLIESASNSNSAMVEEFKMTDGIGEAGKPLNKKEILDQLKAESSSQARVIEIK